MSDKEYDVPVKVIDRRWWANQENAGSAASGSSASLKPTYVEELERKLADKDTQLQDAIARYRGASAEFEESRLRLRREVGKDIERGRREILADLLDVVDNLDRAIDAARNCRFTISTPWSSASGDVVRRAASIARSRLSTTSRRSARISRRPRSMSFEISRRRRSRDSSNSFAA